MNLYDNICSNCDLGYIRGLVLEIGPTINEENDNNGERAIHKAVRLNLTDVVRILLSNELIDINVKDENWNTPLHIAVTSNNFDIVQMLLNKGRQIKVNELNYACEGALHIAAKNGFSKVAKILLNFESIDIDLRNKDNCNTPLYNAVQAGRVDIVRLFLEKRDLIINSDNNGLDSPLHEAVEGRHVTILRILLGDERINVNKDNDIGDTPLHAAVKSGCQEVVEIILQHNEIKQDLCNKTFFQCGSSGKDRLIEYSKQINLSNVSGRTPLDIATQLGFLHISCILLNGGANKITNKEHQNTILFYAAEKGDLDILNLIIEGKLNTEIESFTLRMGGDTLLIKAVKSAQLDVVKLVLKHSPSTINWVNYFGNTALHEARKGGNAKIVQLLLNGADKNLCSEEGDTPHIFEIKQKTKKNNKKQKNLRIVEMLSATLHETADSLKT